MADQITFGRKMSSSKAVEVDLGIHVADGEDLKLSYAGDDLVGSFRDWREVLSVFRCVGVIAFRWQPIEYFLEEERPDSTYEIMGSEWVRQLTSKAQSEALRLLATSS